MNTNYQNSKQYLNYMQELEHNFRILDNRTKDEILNELASHIYEGMYMLQNTTFQKKSV